MNKGICEDIFTTELFSDQTINRLNGLSKQLYGDWIHLLSRGRTFFGLNWNWHTNMPPPSYDTYVFSFHVEQWNVDWLQQVCQKFSDRRIVVISEFPASDRFLKYANLKVLVHHHYGLIIQEVLHWRQPDFVPAIHRSKRLSSLTNKASFFKALTTAYLMRHAPQDEIVISWVNKKDYRCPSLDFLTVQAVKNNKLHDLIDFYHTTLQHQSIVLDDFHETRFSNYFCDIPAYTNCLVNSSNETYVRSQWHDGLNPGPFITEKTWKPLISGCALLPQGAMQTYNYLENFGFNFDYPWPRDFDNVSGDIDRFLLFLENLDLIFRLDCNDLAKKIAPACEHNYHHIRSTRFFNLIAHLNAKNLEIFLQDY